MTINKTKTILLLSIATMLVLSAVALTPNTLAPANAQITNKPPTTTSPCPPADQVQHWDKIIFVLQDNVPPALSNLMGHELDLKVADQPNTVVDLNQEIVQSLEAQYPAVNPALIQSIKIKIIDDKYETVTCGQTGPQGPAGPPGPPGPSGTLTGFSKLIPATCSFDVSSVSGFGAGCSVPGASVGDSVVATLDLNSIGLAQLVITGASVSTNGTVGLQLVRVNGDTTPTPSTHAIANLLVYHN